MALFRIDFKARPLSALILIGHSFNPFSLIGPEEFGESANLLIVLLPECVFHDRVEVLEYIGHDEVSFLGNQLISYVAFVLDSLDLQVVSQFDLELQI